MESTLDGKIVIVTGGNTGIGRATSLQLAAENATVIIASRTESTCKEACDEITSQTGNEKVYYKHLDLASFASIKKCASEILQEYLQIDILINNAAVLGVPLPALTEDGIEVTFGVNHLGHFYLTKLLMETLVKSKARVINISSDAYKLPKPEEFTVEIFEGDNPRIAQPDNKPQGMVHDLHKYGDSKLCNVYFTKELVVRHPELQSVSLHPGTILTNIQRHWRDHTRGVIFMRCFSWMMKSPEIGSKTTLYCCKADIRGQHNVFFKKQMTQELVPVAQNDDVQVALWECSEKLVKQLEKE